MGRMDVHKFNELLQLKGTCSPYIYKSNFAAVKVPPFSPLSALSGPFCLVWFLALCHVT